MSRYVVRRFRNEDKEPMLALFEKIWTKELADKLREMWAWKYEQNPHDPPVGNKTCVLERDGRIIGMMGLLSDLVWVNGRTLPIIWAIDFAVHPDFRGGGFRMVNYEKKMDSDFLQAGIAVAGRPFEFYVKAGYPMVFSFSIFKNIMNPRNFFQKKSMNKAAVLLLTILFKTVTACLSLFRARLKDKDISVIPVSRFDDRFDELWKEACGGYNICMVRDKDFLNWRFFERPDSGYAIFAAEKNGRILGYIVLRQKVARNTRYGTIIDLFTKKGDKQTLQYLIARALDHFRSEHVDRASFAIPPKCRFYRNALIKNGFFVWSKGGRIVLSPAGYKELEKDLMKPENWYLTPLSSDMER
jgi:GNAT superfamily N-acetyltransferase